MGIDSYLQFISVLIIFVVVLGATYYVTKWIANYQKDVGNGNNIEIIETGRISTSKYIQIVKIADRYVAIGVSKDQIVNLGDVDPSAIVHQSESGEMPGFKEILEKIKGEKRNK